MQTQDFTLISKKLKNDLSLLLQDKKITTGFVAQYNNGTWWHSFKRPYYLNNELFSFCDDIHTFLFESVERCKLIFPVSDLLPSFPLSKKLINILYDKLINILYDKIVYRNLKKGWIAQDGDGWWCYHAVEPFWNDKTFVSIKGACFLLVRSEEKYPNPLSIETIIIWKIYLDEKDQSKKITLPDHWQTSDSPGLTQVEENKKIKQFFSQQQEEAKLFEMDEKYRVLNRANQVYE